jgi:hypothetical protein
MDISNEDYYCIEQVYRYDSNNTEYNRQIPVGSIQIPEHDIKNLNLLEDLDYTILKKHQIPLIKKSGDSWSIDLYYYEKVYSNMQS